MKSFKQFFAEAITSLTDEDYKQLYDILDRWSVDVRSVSSEEMSLVRQFQSFFSYTGLMHRVVWLTPHKELEQKEINQINTKQDIMSYERLHSEHSWSKSLQKVKVFAHEFLENDFQFSDFEDKDIQQLIAVFCKQSGTGFDIQKFYKAYNKKFGITSPPVDAISKSAEIQEVVAPIDEASFEAKPVKMIFDQPGVVNRSGKPVVGGGGPKYVEPDQRPKVCNASGDDSWTGKKLWVDIATGKKYKGNPTDNTVEFVFPYEGRWMGGTNIERIYYSFRDFKYQPGDKVIE